MARLTKPLGDTEIRNAKAKDKPYKLYDGNGLYLYITTKGRKYWRIDYKTPLGKRATLSVGEYPAVTLSNARSQNLEVKTQLANGIDPRQYRQEQEERLKGKILFKDFIQDYLTQRKVIIKPNTFKQDYNRTHKDIIPRLGHKPIDEITYSDVKAMADAIESRKDAQGNPPREVTRRTIDLVNKILKHAKLNRIIDTVVSDDLKDLYPKAKTQHMKHVTIDELPQLLRDIDSYHGHPQTRLAIQFLAYSFCRTIELRMMKWEHLDLVNNLWRVDIDNLKVARRHVVPLSRQMIAVLEQMKPLTGQYEYVFYNTGTCQPYSEVFINNALDVLGYAGKQTGHGFRHIASTNLNELGFMGDAIEKQLAHDKKNTIRAVYNHAQHLEERRQIMQVWADFLDMLRDGGQVVDFKQARQQIEQGLITQADKNTESNTKLVNHEKLITALASKGLSSDDIAEIISNL